MICPNCLSQMNEIDAANRLRESFFCSRCNRVYEGVVIPTVTVAEDGFTTYYTDGIKEEVRTKAKNTTDAVEILKRMTDMKQTFKWLLIFIGVAALVIGAVVLIARFM